MSKKNKRIREKIAVFIASGLLTKSIFSIFCFYFSFSFRCFVKEGEKSRCMHSFVSCTIVCLTQPANNIWLEEIFGMNIGFSQSKIQLNKTTIYNSSYFFHSFHTFAFFFFSITIISDIKSGSY